MKKKNVFALYQTKKCRVYLNNITVAQHGTFPSFHFDVWPLAYENFPELTRRLFFKDVIFYITFVICMKLPKKNFPWSLFPLRSCSVLLSSGPCHQSCNWQHSPLYWLLDSRVRFSLTSNKYAGFSQNGFWILNLVSALLNFLLYTYTCCSFCFSPCYILYIFVIHRERLGNVLVGMYPIICTLVHEIGW